ncbi:hypothetical protein DPV78_010458 [Talaromyces pinophilus]|nr:hypothetical protein DPV78_010458 [Talaromyces pinophilus]
MPIRQILPPSQLTKRLERRKLLAVVFSRTLKHTLGIGAHEKHVSLLDFFGFGRSHANLALSTGANDDAWSGDRIKRRLCALFVEVCLDNGELFDGGRVVEDCG